MRPIRSAVGANVGSVAFCSAGEMGSHTVATGASGVPVSGEILAVPVMRLDDLSPAPTFVKMDIEGAEMEALEGGRQLLLHGETAWAVALYHRQEDFWRIPLFIHECNPELRLYLRHYAEDWAETVCYAIPADRVRASGITRGA